MRTLALAIGLSLILAPSSVAYAVEKEHHVGVMVGPSLLVIDDKSSGGAGAGLTYSYGVTDMFNLVVEGESSLLSVGDVTSTTPHTRPKTVSNVGVGVTYVLDVLRWVPYGGVLATGYSLGGGTLDKSLLAGGVELALGLDYKFNFAWSAGVGYRQHMLLTQISTYPTYSTFFLRVEYAWGL